MRRGSRGDYLFRQGRLWDVLRNAERSFAQEITGMDAPYILNVREEDLTQHLVDKYTLEAPEVSGDPEIVSDDEVDIDVSGDPNRVFSARYERFEVKGRRIEIAVPMIGKVDLCKFQPSTHGMLPPSGSVQEHEIRLVFEVTHQDPARLKGEIEGAVKTIRDHCGWIADDLGPYNAGLASAIQSQIKARKEKLSADAGMVAGLGFKMRNIAEKPATIAVPVRRVIRPEPSKSASGRPRALDPTLSVEDYEHILTVMTDMSLVFERNPSTFSKMDEENLRDMFLVSLNGHYEGMATGETFNRQGKTDILIRHQGQNIFICECKVWSGEVELLKAMDQLLSYTTWRDTKTAIVLMNRDRQMSTVLGKVDAIIRKHGSFRKAVDKPRDTEFRYVLAHPDDEEREVRLAVLCFDVPRVA